MHALSRQDVTSLLHVDVIPGIISNFWNSIASRRHTPMNPTLRASILHKEFMARVRHASDQHEGVYRSSNYDRSIHGLRDGDAYYQITTGFTGGPDGSIEIGAVRQDFMHGLRRMPAIRAFFDYTNPEAIDFRFVLRDETGGKPHMLGLGRPKTSEQFDRTMHLVGETIGDVLHGQQVNFQLLGELLKNAGLEDFGTADQAILTRPAFRSSVLAI